MKRLIIFSTVAVSTLMIGFTAEPKSWLDSVLQYESFQWRAATLPGSIREDNYAADIAFMESQANNLRGRILQSIANDSDTYTKQDIIRVAKQIVDAVEMINPNSDLVLPTVLLRADIGGEWLGGIEFESKQLATGFHAYLRCAIAFEVMERENRFVNKYHPTDLDNSYGVSDSDQLQEYRLPLMAFYREDRIKKDLLRSLSILMASEGLDKALLFDLVLQMDIGESVIKWADPLLK